VIEILKENGVKDVNELINEHGSIK